MYVCKIWDNDDRVSGLIISLWNFKKPLDIFSLQIERKRSKEYIVIILAVKESFERFSCLEFIFEKSKRRKVGLKHKQGFSETLFTCLREWKCCLCICFTELLSFYRLLVVSFAILIAVPFVFSRSRTSLAGVVAACIKRFWRLPLVRKNKIHIFAPPCNILYT